MCLYWQGLLLMSTLFSSFSLFLQQVQLLKLKVVVVVWRRGRLGRKHSWEDERILTLFLLLIKRRHQTFQMFWRFIDELLIHIRIVVVLVHRVKGEIWQSRWQVMVRIESQVPDVLKHKHLLGTWKICLILWRLEGGKIGGAQLSFFLLEIFKKSLFLLTFARR